MFENLKNIFKKNKKKEIPNSSSKDAAKERLHLVLMQDRANVSADFLDLMRGEIIEVIKKYIDIDEEAMDVRLTTETNEEGVQGAPALYANIPIINIKDEARNIKKSENENKIKIEPPNKEEVKEEKNEPNQNENSEKDKEEQQPTNEVIEEQKKEKEQTEKQKEEKANKDETQSTDEIEKQTDSKEVSKEIDKRKE